jgi:hypothetical protein
VSYTSGEWWLSGDGLTIWSGADYVGEAARADDARLMAAAPDLLKTAKRARAALSGDDWRNLQRAIDKAERRCSSH